MSYADVCRYMKIRVCGKDSISLSVRCNIMAGHFTQLCFQEQLGGLHYKFITQTVKGLIHGVPINMEIQ